MVLDGLKCLILSNLVDTGWYKVYWVSLVAFGNVPCVLQFCQFCFVFDSKNLPQQVLLLAVASVPKLLSVFTFCGKFCNQLWLVFQSCSLCSLFEASFTIGCGQWLEVAFCVHFPWQVPQLVVASGSKLPSVFTFRGKFCNWTQQVL